MYKVSERIHILRNFLHKPYLGSDILNNWKSLMTLMTVTLMTRKASKHSFVFLMKQLSCLSHCFRSPIVGFYQQWALVILHNLDSD